MIERLYVHNYRCFENFTLDLKGLGSALLIGKNGSGKSTLRHALGVLQGICRKANRARYWIGLEDFSFARRTIPMRFEVEVVLGGKRYRYVIAFDFPEQFREPRIVEEQLTVDGNSVFARQMSQVNLPNSSGFGLDWHVGALPVINERPGEGSIQQLKAFFASLMLLSPVPQHMLSYSEDESPDHEPFAGNFVGWLNLLLSRSPARYAEIAKYIQEVIPDFSSFEFVPHGERGTRLRVQFEQKSADAYRAFVQDFGQLSDGEKCFFLSAAILAFNRTSKPVFCFWDEPDNHLALSEVGHFITELRRMSNREGQFVATSHHPETIRRFSDENTFVLTRNTHLEPTVVRPLSELPYGNDLVRALTRGEVL